MKYAQDWNRQISGNTGKILAFFCLGIFFLYQFFIYGQLKAAKFTKDAQEYLRKAQGLEGQDIIVEQIVSYGRAIRLLAQATKSNPLDASTYFALAESLNNKAGQVGQWNEALNLEGLNPATRGRDISLIELAKRNYTEAVKLNPTNAIYHQRLGSVYEKLSNYAQAEAELKKALSLDPKNVSIHLYLAQYFLSRNKQSEFGYHLARVVELYKLALAGGGPMDRLKNMVEDYLESIDKAELIKR